MAHFVVASARKQRQNQPHESSGEPAFTQIAREMAHFAVRFGLRTKHARRTSWACLSSRGRVR
eukprot:1313377-Alexandrium_andersonii.AAC.1